jgi:hypothetical protein
MLCSSPAASRTHTDTNKAKLAPSATRQLCMSEERHSPPAPRQICILGRVRLRRRGVLRARLAALGCSYCRTLRAAAHSGGARTRQRPAPIRAPKGAKRCRLLAAAASRRARSTHLQESLRSRSRCCTGWGYLGDACFQRHPPLRFAGKKRTAVAGFRSVLWVWNASWRPGERTHG